MKWFMFLFWFLSERQKLVDPQDTKDQLEATNQRQKNPD